MTVVTPIPLRLALDSPIPIRRQLAEQLKRFPEVKELREHSPDRRIGLDDEHGVYHVGNLVQGRAQRLFRPFMGLLRPDPCHTAG